MKTYTVTATSATESETFSNKTLAEAKAIKKALWSYTVSWKQSGAVEAPKAWFYRGQQVELVEEVTNGYTLVNFVDGSRYFFHAVTNELEYR